MDPYADDEFVCPICGNCVHLVDGFAHVFNTHPAFLLVWSSITFPSGINDTYYRNEVRDFEYELLTELCDLMGTCKIGIKNLDSVANVATFDEAFAQGNDECPICLESFVDKDIRKIKICEHMFCFSCISQWLSNNTKCPLCRIDICEESTPTD